MEFRVFRVFRMFRMFQRPVPKMEHLIFSLKRYSLNINGIEDKMS
jgi:hypothetical protein